jgi:hypothetical protein
MEEAEVTLSHFMKCWQKDPQQTSGCIVLPRYQAHLISDVAQHARVLRKYGKGTVLFQRPDAQGVYKPAGKLAFPCSVYMIDRLPEGVDTSLRDGLDQDSMLEPPAPIPMAFKIQGMAKAVTPGTKRNSRQASPVDILIDTGASTRFVSERWVKERNVLLHTPPKGQLDR